MRAVGVILQTLVIGLLCWIGYNTGVGKTLPVHHPSWMSCDGKLTRSLFYSTLLKQNDGTVKLSARVKEAQSIEEIDKLVADGSNIDARRTLWFESVSDPGRCQAQVYLEHPNETGNNTAYIGFSIAGFARPDRGFVEALQGGEVLESLELEMIGARWFQE